MSDSIDEHLKQARERLASLRNAETFERTQPASVRTLLEELSTNMEELQVATEELRQQNNELAATRLQIGELRRSYQELFDLAPDGYIVTDPRGIIRQANLAAATLLGVRTDFLTGKPMSVFVAPGVRSDFRVRCERMADARETVEWTSQLHPRDGAAVSLKLRVAPIRDASGDLTGLRWNLTDITESKLAAEAVRKAGQFSQATIDALSANLCVLDEHGVILFTNKAWDTFAQSNPPSSRNSEVGANYLNVCDAATGPDAADAKAIADGIRDVIPGRKETFCLEYPCHSPSEQRWFAARVTRFPGGGAVVVHENITERMLAEEAFRKIDRALKTSSACNHAIVRAEAEQDLLQGVCRAIVERGGYRMGWIGFPEDDEEKSIRIAARAGFDPAYLDNARIRWAEDDEHGMGPAGVALRTGQTVVCNDFLNHPGAGPWRKEVADHGYASVVVFPLKRDDKTFGLLVIYAAELDAFQEKETELLTELAADIAFGIESMRNRVKRREAEAALRVSEASLIRAQQIAGVGNWDWNIVSDELYWSAQIYELFGMVPSEQPRTYKRFLQGVHPEDRERVHTAVEDAVAGLAPYDIEHRVLWPDGTVREMYERGEVTRDANGRALHMIGTVQDITERKRAQESLRASEERFRTMANSMSQLAWIARADGYITWYNRRWYEYTGTTPEQMEGWGWQSVHDPDVLPKVMEIWTGAISAGRTFEMEFPLRGADGRFRTFLTRGEPLKDSEGRVVQWFGTNTDVEALKQKEADLSESERTLEARVIERTARLEKTNAELEAANRHKSEFLSGMSHELRTPLNAIVGFTGTLLMKLPGPLNADQEKQLRTVQTSAKHLLSLINDLLDLAKIEAGKRELHIEPVVGSQVIEEVATTMRGLAKAKGLGFQVVTPASEITLRTDRRALSQILLNLAGNAVKFTARGSVGIELVQRSGVGGRFVEFRITDSGPGITPEDQALLFGVFTRGHSSGSQRAEGSGLGLHLSQNLAILLGGRILLESEPGKGSTFTLRLPHT